MGFRIVGTLKGRFHDTVINERAVDCDGASSSDSGSGWLGALGESLHPWVSSLRWGLSCFIYLMTFYEEMT